jgi:A/G-specific adenine glycosylase
MPARFTTSISQINSHKHPRKTFFVNWFKTQGRSFPWRKRNISPYKILVTEMLLRQTRASNVSSMWTSFTDRYSTPKLLLSASKKDLFKHLRILGFVNQRSDALRLAASWLIQHHRGRVPASLDELLQVPHIGEYSSRAILCFAYGAREEIVDSNVLRFFSRYYGLALKPDNRRNPIAWQIAREVLPRGARSIREHNYGILDFTAEICKSGKPLCHICPLSQSCQWATTQLQVANVTTKSSEAQAP